LYDGVAESGVSVHLVDAHEDHGPVLRQQAFAVPAGASLSEYLGLVLAIGPPLLVDALSAMISGSVAPVVQADASPTRRARRLRSDDQFLVAWNEWDLERTWRVLRGVGPILGWPPPRWQDLGSMPVIDVAVGEPHNVHPGQRGSDAAGYYLGHPGGKIRFHYRWAPRPWLTSNLRDSPVAGGLIAAERAAWPPLAAVPGAPHGQRPNPR
jgi:hypothetical protein